MNKLKPLFLGLVVVALTSSAYADGGHSHAKKKEVHVKEGKEMTLNGHLIGLTCYIKHGAEGASHKKCAKQCAESGLPIGLKTDGSIYEVSGHGHQSLIEAYKPLLKYLEEDVVVQGTVFERSGIKMITIKKIKKS